MRAGQLQKVTFSSPSLGESDILLMNPGPSRGASGYQILDNTRDRIATWNKELHSLEEKQAQVWNDQWKILHSQIRTLMEAIGESRCEVAAVREEALTKSVWPDLQSEIDKALSACAKRMAGVAQQVTSLEETLAKGRGEFDLQKATLETTSKRLENLERHLFSVDQLETLRTRMESRLESIEGMQALTVGKVENMDKLYNNAEARLESIEGVQACAPTKGDLEKIKASIETRMDYFDGLVGLSAGKGDLEKHKALIESRLDCVEGLLRNSTKASPRYSSYSSKDLESSKNKAMDMAKGLQTGCLETFEKHRQEIADLMSSCSQLSNTTDIRQPDGLEGSDYLNSLGASLDKNVLFRRKLGDLGKFAVFDISTGFSAAQLAAWMQNVNESLEFEFSYLKELHREFGTLAITTTDRIRHLHTVDQHQSQQESKASAQEGRKPQDLQVAVLKITEDMQAMKLTWTTAHTALTQDLRELMNRFKDATPLQLSDNITQIRKELEFETKDRHQSMNILSKQLQNLALVVNISAAQQKAGGDSPSGKSVLSVDTCLLDGIFPSQLPGNPGKDTVSTVSTGTDSPHRSAGTNSPGRNSTPHRLNMSSSHPTP